MEEVSFGAPQVDHVEYLCDLEAVDHQLELATIGYFVHVLPFPFILLHGALDSNHGIATLVSPLAIDGLELQSLLETWLVPSVYHQMTVSSWILEMALKSMDALGLLFQRHRLDQP